MAVTKDGERQMLQEQVNQLKELIKLLELHKQQLEIEHRQLRDERLEREKNRGKIEEKKDSK